MSQAQVHYVKVVMNPTPPIIPSDFRIKKLPGFEVVSARRTVACWCDQPCSDWCAIISRIHAWEQAFCERAGLPVEIHDDK